MKSDSAQVKQIVTNIDYLRMEQEDRMRIFFMQNTGRYLFPVFMILSGGISAHADVGKVCARGYVSELVINTRVSGSQGSNSTNISVKIDGSEFSKADYTDGKEFLTLHGKEGWVHIGLKEIEQYSTFVSQLIIAQLSRMPVRIVSRDTSNNNKCRKDEDKFELVVCTKKEFCQY